MPQVKIWQYIDYPMEDQTSDRFLAMNTVGEKKIQVWALLPGYIIQVRSNNQAQARWKVWTWQDSQPPTHKAQIWLVCS